MLSTQLWLRDPLLSTILSYQWARWESSTPQNQVIHRHRHDLVPDCESGHLNPISGSATDLLRALGQVIFSLVLQPRHHSSPAYSSNQSSAGALGTGVNFIPEAETL